jgi:hypothetical protein
MFQDGIMFQELFLKHQELGKKSWKEWELFSVSLLSFLRKEERGEREGRRGGAAPPEGGANLNIIKN